MKLQSYIQIACFTTAASASATVTAAATTVSVADRIRGAYYGALVADALCLGSHYEYDAHKIRDAYNGTIDKYMAPGEQMGGQTHGVGWGKRNYHPGTVAGDQTDYGEYNVLVLEHLANVVAAGATDADDTVSNSKAFDLEAFLPYWQDRLTNGSWKQWVCTQTKHTYHQLQQPPPTIPIEQLGGNSNAVALRFASMYAMYDTEDLIVDAAKKVMFTHRERTAVLGNEFFARTVFRIIHHTNDQQNQSDTTTADTTTITSNNNNKKKKKNTKYNAARTIFVEVARDMNDPWITQKIQQALEKYDEVTDPQSSLYREGGEYVDDLALTSMARLWDVGKSEPIKVGKASPTEGTLPGALYFVLKYYDDDNENSACSNSCLMTAAKANVMVGGDNASRSIALGMIIGALEGVNAIPLEFQTGLNHWNHSKALLETLPLLKNRQQAGSSEL